MKRRIFTYGIFVGASALIALAAMAMPRRPAPPIAPPSNTSTSTATSTATTSTTASTAKNDPPKVEVVFALDTTGSMSGLIDGAKRKIWSIASYISSAQPKPVVRIGLVGYRDKGDAYVTKFYDLSDDLDTVFEHLMQFRADGGGDTPEHVAKALHDAVERSSWSDGQNVVKIVYLVGDAPPHTDYDDGYDYKKISRHAAQKGIHVNTILCGNDHDARLAWNEIAHAGGGDFASVEQSGGVATVATPYDDKLAELNRRLAGTAFGYGAASHAVAAKRAAVMAMPAPMAADRAAVAGSYGMAVSGEGDLLSDLKKGKVSLETISPSAMPEPMRAMSAGERKAFVAKEDAERESTIDGIKTLAHKREEYLKQEAARTPRASGFDDEVRKSLSKDASGLLKFN